MYKLFAFDIDGTLLPFGQPKLDPKIHNMFKRLKEVNATTVFVTGREFISIGDMINTPYVDYFLGANGTFIYDIKNKKILFEKTVVYNDIKKLQEFCDEKNINYNLISETSVYFKDKTEFKGHWFWEEFYDLIKPIDDPGLKNDKIHQITLTAHNDKDKKMLADFVATQPNIEVNTIWEGGLFVGPVGVNKATGLEKLGQILKIDLEDMAAFGDAENDIEMLKEVGMGCAMGNAEDFVKSTANEVCGTVNDFGAIKKLESMSII